MDGYCFKWVRAKYKAWNRYLNDKSRDNYLTIALLGIRPQRRLFMLRRNMKGVLLKTSKKTQRYFGHMLKPKQNLVLVTVVWCSTGHCPNDLRWNSHVSNICTKSYRTFGFLRQNLYACPQAVKEAAYKGLVRPVLGYSGSVWDPSGVGLQNELEKVQNRATRFVTRNYNYETGSMTGILEHLKWESLKKQRRDNIHILLYKGLKDKANIPTDDLIHLGRHCRNYSMAYQVPIANTDIYKYNLPHTPLGVGMHSRTLLSPLLKVPRMVLLSSLLW